MKFVKTSLLSFFILLFFQSQAQNPLIKGYIYDSQTKQPIIGATIAIVMPESEQTILSDKSGYFEIQDKQSSDKLQITMLGYKSQAVKVNYDLPVLNIQLEA